MALSITTVDHTYTGDGSTTTFPIPFTFFNNTQVKVEETDTTTGVITQLTQGAEFTISGGDPGTSVLATTAPSATKTWRVYRSTPLTQIYDFINNTTVNLENIEKALDRIVMMAQEIANGAVIGSGGSGGSYQINPLQTIVAGGTVTVTADVLRQLCKVQGDTGGTTASTTTAIDNGTVDGQELVLLGQSDTNPLTLNSTTTNLAVNGNVILFNNSALTLVWDSTNTKWVELNRRS